MLLWVESLITLFRLLIFSLGLNFANIVHFELERFVGYDRVLLEHFLQVFQSRSLRLECVSKHGVSQSFLLLGLKVNDLVFDILGHFFCDFV